MAVVGGGDVALEDAIYLARTCHMNTTVIGVAGGTGSGKSTLVRKLREAFAEEEVITLSHDYYYKSTFFFFFFPSSSSSSYSSSSSISSSLDVLRNGKDDPPVFFERKSKT